MRNLRIASAASAIALVLAGTIAAPAHAEVYGIDDGADAAGSLSDILSLSARHGTGRLVVKTRFADLRRDSQAGMSIFVDTDRLRRGPEYVLGTGLGDGTDYQLSRARRWQSVGAPLDCSYLLQVRWRREVAKAFIDRDCLGEPAKVRVSVKMRDLLDASHPVTDWVPGTRRWSLGLAPG